MFARVDWQNARIPDLPKLVIDESQDLTARVANLMPLKYFGPDGQEKLCLCKPMDMVARRDRSFTYDGEEGDPIDVASLMVVYQQYTQHKYRHYGLPIPDLAEVAWQLPRGCWGKKLYLLVEGPSEYSDLRMMWNYVERGEHIARMTLFV
jgi:hypothetical protein